MTQKGREKLGLALKIGTVALAVIMLLGYVFQAFLL